MALIPDYTFMPVVHHQAKSILWSADPKTPQQWEDVFRCAYSVHFYSHYNDRRNVGFVVPIKKRKICRFLNKKNI